MLTNKKHSFKKEVASTATKGYKIALLAGVITLFSVNTTKAQLTLAHSNVFCCDQENTFFSFYRCFTPVVNIIACIN